MDVWYEISIKAAIYGSLVGVVLGGLYTLFRVVKKKREIKRDNKKAS